MQCEGSQYKTSANSIIQIHGAEMTIDPSTAIKIANLAQIETTGEQINQLSEELSRIIAFMEQLNEVDVSNVEPMTSVTPMTLKLRTDEISDGNKQFDILKNAPRHSAGFFTVPKVIE